jgi:hypothetical protein
MVLTLIAFTDATEHIKRGTELSLDYGPYYLKSWEQAPVIPQT